MASSEEEVQQQPPQPQQQSTDESASETVLYKTKTIKFFGHTTPIILQNENGPCLLIAICNVLLLKNELNLPADVSEVSQEKLYSLVVDILHNSNSNNSNKDAGYVENQRQNISDAINLLPRLTTGINVNVKFDRIDAFELSPECAIVDLLGISLCHGWLVDPQDHEIAEAIGSKSYNTLMEDLVSLKKWKMENVGEVDNGVKDACDMTPKHGISLRQGELIDNFLKSNASQLTFHGLLCLQAGLDNHKLCVFFRNNHFSTMLKLDGELYLLATDQGYMDQPDLVWEKLNEVNGDTVFMTSDFKEFRLDVELDWLSDAFARARLAEKPVYSKPKPKEFPWPKKLTKTTPITSGDVELPQLGCWGSLQHCIRHIFLSCPPRTLLSWRCVNKEWKSYLTHETFLRNHMQNCDKRLIIFSINEDTIVALTFPDLEYFAEFVVPVPIKKRFSSRGALKATSTIDGLVVLQYIPMLNLHSNAGTGLLLWNPTLNRFREIPILEMDSYDKRMSDVSILCDDTTGNYYMVARVFFRIKEEGETLCLHIYLLKVKKRTDNWAEAWILSYKKLYYDCNYLAQEGVVVKKKCLVADEDRFYLLHDVFDICSGEIQSINLPDIGNGFGYNDRPTLYYFGYNFEDCIFTKEFLRE